MLVTPRGRKIRKLMSKGKGKSIGPSSSNAKKVHSMDEVLRVGMLEVQSFVSSEEVGEILSLRFSLIALN